MVEVKRKMACTIFSLSAGLQITLMSVPGRLFFMPMGIV